MRLRLSSRMYNQVRGGMEVSNKSPTFQHGSNKEAHRLTGWTMDVSERRFGMLALRRVDIGAPSEGSQERMSFGTSVASRKTALANCASPVGASGSISMGMFEDMVCCKDIIFLLVTNITSRFEYHFCIYFPLA